jgi:micrococcal nuclease
MATYSQPICENVYKVSYINRIVDGDMIDVTIDLGFGVYTQQRVCLLGIRTPASRTRNREEKKYGLLTRFALSELLPMGVNYEEGDVKIQLRCLKSELNDLSNRISVELWIYKDDKWTNVNKWLCENAYAVPYSGQNKESIESLHMLNRTKLNVRGELLKVY